MCQKHNYDIFWHTLYLKRVNCIANYADYVVGQALPIDLSHQVAYFLFSGDGIVRGVDWDRTPSNGELNCELCYRKFGWRYEIMFHNLCHQVCCPQRSKDPAIFSTLSSTNTFSLVKEGIQLLASVITDYHFKAALPSLRFLTIL